MTVVTRVRVLGTGLRVLCGGRELELQAVRVRELLLELSARGGEALFRQLFGDGDPPTLHPDLRVLVNGRDVRFLQGLETPVDALDAVTLHLAGARSLPGG